MRHPLWILNSALLLLLIIAAGFTFVAQVEVPEREEIKPSDHKKTIQKPSEKINIPAIYQNDLFGSYVKKVEEPEQVPAPTEPPPAPAPVTIPIPVIAEPKFTDPLNITLKGIIIVTNDDRKNRAIIADNTTSKEQLYKVEDLIEDARLIKILSNKVIFLRAGGQQEVLYLRHKDAELDPVYAVHSNWSNIIEQVNDTTYIIHTALFVDRVKNLAQCIDLLDLITVYQKGKSIGCRIGNVDENTLGNALGFHAGDIIMGIDDIAPTDTEQRMNIYKKIIAMKAKETFKILLRRQGSDITLTYMLSDTKKPAEKTSETGAASKPAQTPNEELTQEQIKALEERHTFAPTLKDIRDRERQNMLEKGRAPQNSSPSSINE
jgi:type II secretory pathway component PulC